MLMQEQLVLRAPAKINLYLKVTGRRDDGYHTLETLMQKVDLCDELILRKQKQGIRVRCSDDMLPGDRGNLVYRAAEAFLQAMGGAESSGGVEISLNKKIPIAAGLGGGSSDAAATLKGLNLLFGCRCSNDELTRLGLRLGADVPFFLAESSASFAVGIGEVLTPAPPLNEYSILLVNPGFPVSTQWVYQTFALTNNREAGSFKNLQKGADVASVLSGSADKTMRLAVLQNDLEAVTASRYPEIKQLKSELVQAGADMALMSGSGPTVFGLFKGRSQAEACFSKFKHRYTHVYLVTSFSEK